ncbi:MAG TPA: xanthine dehydrogenase family protein subunit M [Beijerinckiaceae bacterium]|jgi:carbon-monoxide dehydrogenase medium subunit|nr:xanthine dehydrogenase family protein subunit M [Beijerinckiaceae bacterium]
MYAFTYHRPETLEAALDLAGSEEAKLLAGGQTLLPTMKQRLASPAHIIDLGRLADLRFIRATKSDVAIGAMTPHVMVATSTEIAERIPALAALAGMIGDPAVRHRGTIGGSIANDDPAADYPAACLALAATIVTSKRRIAADEFFRGLFETALDDGEIIIEVSFPVPDKAAYEKFPQPASRFALVGVFVAKRSEDVRVAVTGAGGDGVFRVRAFEDALKDDFSPKAIEGIAVSSDGLASDIHADAEYRAHLIGVMTRRAVTKAG